MKDLLWLLKSILLLFLLQYSLDQQRRSLEQLYVIVLQAPSVKSSEPWDIYKLLQRTWMFYDMLYVKMYYAWLWIHDNVLWMPYICLMENVTEGICHE